jgi:hypothetical protein
METLPRGRVGNAPARPRHEDERAERPEDLPRAVGVAGAEAAEHSR